MPCGFPNNFPCASNTSYTPKCKKKTCNNDWYESKSNETLYKSKLMKGSSKLKKENYCAVWVITKTINTQSYA